MEGQSIFHGKSPHKQERLENTFRQTGPILFTKHEDSGDILCPQDEEVKSHQDLKGLGRQAQGTPGMNFKIKDQDSNGTN